MSHAVIKPRVGDFVASLLVRLANRLSQYKFKAVEKNQFDTVARMKRLIDEVNGTMYQIPRGYSIWVAWDFKPPLLCLRVNDGADTLVIWPPKATSIGWERDATRG